MCGIVGYVGYRKASEVIYNGLLQLEYRGYDSSGICCEEEGVFYQKKDIGKLKDIQEKHDLLSLPGSKGIGHCRWATHGGVTKENAHPHTSMGGLFKVVHNGIIENYMELREELSKEGVFFATPTDTEVIANLLESLYKKTKDLKQSLKMLMEKLDGSFGLNILCKDFPDLLIGIKHRSPLVLGVGENEMILASDVLPIVNYTKDVVYLDNQEIVILSKNSYEIYSASLKLLNKKISRIEWNASVAEKHGFDHFMLKEIFEQPDVVNQIIKEYVNLENMSVDLKLSFEMEEILLKAKRINFVACGTSFHASLMGEFMIEEVLRLPSEVQYASEFRYRNPIIEEETLFIPISQSGETADTLAAMEDLKKKKAPVLAVVNVPKSSIDRLADDSIYMFAGVEIGVASTKAFVAQMVVMYLLTLYLGQKKNILSPYQVRKRLEDLKLIPFQMQHILEDDDYIKSIAEQYYEKSNAIYLGRGINFPIALEGALKLKEVSYIHAEGYPAAELKHGPIALIDVDMPVFVVATKDTKVYSKLKSNLQEIRAREGEIIAVTSKGDYEILKYVEKHIHIPSNSYLLTPLLSIIPLQMIAYYITVLRSLDPDKPRNLAKSVTVE